MLPACTHKSTLICMDLMAERAPCIAKKGTVPSVLLCNSPGQADEAAEAQAEEQDPNGVHHFDAAAVLLQLFNNRELLLAEQVLFVAEEGAGTPSWLLCGSEGQADEAAEPQADERDEDGLQHFDITPEPL